MENGGRLHVNGGDREDEVFEEAMETPRDSFMTPHHPDVRDLVFEDGDEELRSVAAEFEERVGGFGEEGKESSSGVVFGDDNVDDFDSRFEEAKMVGSVDAGEGVDARDEELRSVAAEFEERVGGFGEEGKESSSGVVFGDDNVDDFDSRFEAAKMVGSVDAGEGVDAPVNGEQHVDTLPDVQVNGHVVESIGEVDEERSGGQIHDQIDAQSPDGERTDVGFEGKTGESVGYVEEAVAEAPRDVTADAGENVVEYRDVSENGRLVDLNSDGSHIIEHENFKNDESHVVGLKEPVADVVEASPEHDSFVMTNGPSVGQIRELLADGFHTSNGISSEQTKEIQTTDIHSTEDPEEIKNVIETETSASVGKEGNVVEGLAESRSSDDYSSSNPSSEDPLPNSHPVSSGSPPLPSSLEVLKSSIPAESPSLPSEMGGPVGLGSSALRSVPSLLSRTTASAGLGSSALTGAPSSPSSTVGPAGLGSSALKGSPSLSSRPAGPGSSATGLPSLPSRPNGQGSPFSTGGPSLLPRSNGPSGLGSSAPLGMPSPSHPVGLGSSAPMTTSVPSLPSRPSGPGSSAPVLEPANRSIQQPRANGSISQRPSQPSEEIANEESGDTGETREKLQMIRVKFLRLALRLGQTPHNVVVAQVLYRLGLAEQLSRNTNRPGVFSFDQASIMAEHLETGGQEPLDFSCTIMVIGKTGVGKSSTINSIFDEVKFQTNAFQPSTKKVQEIVGTVQGIKVRVIDTPGLYTSSFDQRHNEKVLRSVKRFINKTSPDIVLYIDRLDMQSRDFGDVPLLRTVTDVFGASIWFNAIVVLTHASSAPPDGPSGAPLSYEMFVTQRSHVVQQAIRQAAGDVRLMNPVSLVENHSACRMNRAGQRVLPNGQVWKPQLLLLSFASKILAEANLLLQLQDGPPGRARARVPPLPFLLNSLLQSRAPLKLPDEQFDDEDSLDVNADEATDSDGESDYDDLPPFKCLTKAQLEMLNKAQKKAYFEELEYREKLFFRKQLKQEKKRRKLMKKMAEEASSLPSDYSNENMEDESSGPATVPVPMPDYALPASFDSDAPSHRYRFLDSSSSWLVRPVLDSQGWDHDVGYESLNVERLFVVKDKIPLSVSGQITKDKKDFNLQMEAASSIKHSEGKATSLVMDMQTVGKEVAYTLRGETMVKNFRRNNTTAGLSVTKLGDSVSAGLKLEDKLIVNESFRLLMSGGLMNGRGDVAYGGRLEATLRDKDYPIGRMLSTLALSIVDWRGDMAVGGNIQSNIPLGRGTNLIVHGNVSNRGSGQVGIRLNSSEYLQISLLALIPVLKNIKRVLSGSSQSM